MKIKQLFKDLPVTIKGSKESRIHSLSSHSGRVAPGALFIAKKGQNSNGSLFVMDAVKAGATAILTNCYNPFLSGVVQVITSDVEGLEPLIAKRYYHSPTRELFVVGITGTDGKTTTAYLVKHLLGGEKKSCGLIGTIEYDVGSHTVPAELTTPDTITNHRLFREMADHQLQSVVMEVSSHALDQGRVEGVDFDAAIFTNLGRDHLDYHRTMERYLEAKLKLFDIINEKKGCAVINRDDPAYDRIYEAISTRCISYGMDKRADLYGKIVSKDLHGMTMEVSFEEKTFPLSAPLIAQFNAYNMLAAVGIALSKGIEVEMIQERLNTLPPIPGRLEKIDHRGDFDVFVDFAHTPQALCQVAKDIKELIQGKLILLFGAGGERDQGKRPEMGRAVEQYADLLIVTSDNPRSEDPEKIIADICTGFSLNKHVVREPCRRSAIRKAFCFASPGDSILIAGRGHEPMQKIEGRSIPFDDRKVACEELANRV